MICQFWILLVGFTTFIPRVSLLKLVKLEVPEHTIRGHDVRLECHFDLEGESLYSVKWFKDNREFYQFLPENDPPAESFNIPGFFIDVRNSTDTSVLLRKVNLNASGQYRCEVTGEAPSFQSAGQSKYIHVVDLPNPKDGPSIEGQLSRYNVNDRVKLNCSSVPSVPPATLAFYINGNEISFIDEGYTKKYPIFKDEQGLETRVLGLEFKIRREHFEKGNLKVKCLANIGTIYWRTNEISIENYARAQRTSTLESRADKRGYFSLSQGSSHLQVKCSSSQKIISIVFLISLVYLLV